MSRLRRDFWRAATRIAAALEARHRTSQPLTIPYRSWELLLTLVRRLGIAQDRHWSLAAEQLRQLSLRQLAWFQNDLQQCAHELQSAQPATIPVTVPSLYRDLVALEEEFDGLEIDLSRNTLTVTTDEITLDGHWLGRFTLIWNWSLLGQARELVVVALDPQSPEDRDDITHPHVSNNLLCVGDARPGLQAALSSGRLYDYFLIVQQVLRTYNAHSAYVTLDDWTGRFCTDCAARRSSDDLVACDRCGHDLCDDCCQRCSDCDQEVCWSCFTVCQDCGCGYCETCWSFAQRRQGNVCPNCRALALSSQESADDPPASTEIPSSSSPDPEAAVHADRLVETALAAGPG